MLTIKTNKGINIHIIDNDNIINNEVINNLKNFDKTIWWSNGRLIHYFVDYKVGNTWIESKQINFDTNSIFVSLYKK